MTELQIRHAVPADAAAIASLLEQLGYPTEAAEIPGRLDRLIANERVAVLAAQRGDMVVGLATVHVFAVLNRRRDVALLTLLVVDQSARGTGVGRRLVHAVEEFARASHCERLSVTTQENRADAHAFYVRIGLKQTGRRFGKALTS